MEVITAILEAQVPLTSVQAILTALGITSSIISFVLTNVLGRPAMFRWRRAVWRILALQWTSVMVCFIDFVYPYQIGGVANLGSKLGIGLWSVALVTLLWLLRQVFFLSFTRSPPWIARYLRPPVEPFEDVSVTTFGAPFLDAAAASVRASGLSIAHPILLMSERSAHGLGLARCFAGEGLRDELGAVVWLGFTRPWTIVAEQLASPLVEAGLRSERPLVIVDCYSALYFHDESREIARHPSMPSLRVEYCDPRDPLAVKEALKQVLRDLRQSGTRRVRVVYDSLSDFLAVADRELVVPYLRWSTVWEELHHVQSIYLVWPDVLKEPVSAEYLAWFGNSVLTLKRDGDCFAALLEGVGAEPIRLAYDDHFAAVPPTPSTPEPSLLRWMSALLNP